MTCRWCGSKQAAIDEGDVHECIRCHILFNAVRENPKAALKMLVFIRVEGLCEREDSDVSIQV